MSHQHQGQTDASRDGFIAMGYGHFAFSNYYPSAPTYPLPPSYISKHPELIAAPNAEHHSFTDAGLHANALGSMLATGYGSEVKAKDLAVSPLVHRFDGLHVFDAERPWLGVYRLDLRLTAKADKSTVTLSIEGADECDFRSGFASKGPIKERALEPGNHTLYLRTVAPSIEAKLVFDASAITITQFRLMQGTNRPWRDVFRAALDGELVDGQRSGGLLYPDGGGMTLNHPTGKVADYLTMLDFDSRVLGIEVWNQLTSGFGSNRGFYDETPGPHLHFYELWDTVLRTGRRCWGFFVKDHNTYGRGRNVLLVPKLDNLSPIEREAAALRAYRHGAFFGSVASLAASDTAEVVVPYDHSDFRFSRINVRRDAQGKALAIEVAVAGNDSKKPHVQIRFVTDKGVAARIDAPQGEFFLERNADGQLIAQFIRIEAFAYPCTHLQGQPLTPAMISQMNVYDISLLHDQKALRGQAFASNSPALRTPIPIADMIFSQPLRRI